MGRDRRRGEAMRVSGVGKVRLLGLCLALVLAFAEASSAAEYCATYDPGPPLTMFAGETRTIPVKVTNCGTRSWGPPEAYIFSCMFTSGTAIMPGACASVPLSVPAGNSTTSNITVTAPGVGTHTLMIDIAKYSGILVPNPALLLTFSSAGVPLGQLPITVVPAITKVSATLAVEPASFKGACPAKIKVSATVTANGKGTVDFHFVGEKKGPTGVLTPAGATDLEFTPQKHTITFDGPGTKSVSFDFQVGKDFVGTVALETTSPVKSLSNKVAVNFDCTPVLKKSLVPATPLKTR